MPTGIDSPFDPDLFQFSFLTRISAVLPAVTWTALTSRGVEHMADTQLQTLMQHVSDNEDVVAVKTSDDVNAKSALQSAQQFADQKAQELSDAQGQLNASVDAAMAYLVTLKK